MTPSRLAKWGLLVLGVGLIPSFVLASMAAPWAQRGLKIWYAMAAVAGLLLLGASVAKVIQIGVRSARDDDQP